MTPNLGSLQMQKRAFTLIEMMIVIGIIALLAALTLGISSSVLRNSEISRTKNVLKLLDMALQEWEQNQGRLMTYMDYTYTDGTFDIEAEDGILDVTFGGNVVDNETMQFAMEKRVTEFVNVVDYSESAKDVLNKISPDHLEKTAQGIVPLDSWGNAIGIVFPGSPYLDTYGGSNNAWPRDQSGDLSIRDQAEDGLGSCINLRPYFVSAGPDGLWGYLNQANGGPDTADQIEHWEATKDNIYSYEPFIVEQAR